ncbi:nucleotide sugar dehydrogenase [Gammaproteobacteria bacterium]|nr:nucleotide sugar dehydrogenase [Gammaproteobacteria bacterium]
MSAKKSKITVVGAGYVGMSVSILLGRQHKVTLFDINKSKIKAIQNDNWKKTFKDPSGFIKENQIDIFSTTNKELAYKDADIIIIATPTDYSENTNRFDTSSVDGVVSDIFLQNKKAIILIKSTVPVGYTDSLKEKYKTSRVIFSPEFLTEGNALYDNLFPSRIVIGDSSEKGKLIANILSSAALLEDPPTLLVSAIEAESIKLFANTFLAMRVAFFNELDSFAFAKKLDSYNLIKGISLDPRIGDYYNNPSFGYGGYCLPKDTKQLLAEYENMPQKLIAATISSNEIRKEFISNQVLSLDESPIGIYRLSMKKDSDNFRSSAILDVIKKISKSGKKIYIYEPLLKDNFFIECEVIKNIDEFKDKCSIILANRIDSEIDDIKSKCFSRDLFNAN